MNMTSNLDVLCQQDAKNISSNEKLKDEALKCLINIIECAPDSEYKGLIESEKHEILLGYLLSIACQLAKNDKSRSIRLQALDLIGSLTNRLDLFHKRQSSPQDRCGVATIILGLPGVSSALFKIFTSDTKLPRALLVKSLKTLAKIISVSFSKCDHSVTSHLMDASSPKSEKNLIDTCDNLAARIGFLVDYVVANCDDIHNEVKSEMLNFCLVIVTETKTELLTRTLKPVVKYLAFVSSTLDQHGPRSQDMQLRLMLLIDNIRLKMQDSNDQGDRLDSMAIDCLCKLLDEFEESGQSMLGGERQARLAMLCGLLKLLTQDIMTTFLEVPDRRNQLLTTLIQLVEFSSQQPFLFLTESRIEPGALEQRSERIYTTEKQFVHLTDKEIIFVNTCCQILGNNLEWSFLCEILKSDLTQFNSASNLYVTMQLLKGCLDRSPDHSMGCRLTKQLIEGYTESIQSNCVAINQSVNEGTRSAQILRTVIEIETVAVILQLHVKFTTTDSDQRVIILRDLLCPLLNWCSSSSRAVSEAALNALYQIGQLYGHESTKSFIEEYIDYIVNGVSKLLENFMMNPEVTDVLAITFKLSSLDTFYYFKDVFEKIFKTLARFHNTRQSKSLALLLLRTVTILNDWLDAASGDVATEDDECPLESEQSLQSVLRSLDIEGRIARLRCGIEDETKLRQTIREVSMRAEEDEEEVKRQIELGEVDAGSVGAQEPGETKENDEVPKRDEIVLTERIIKHCIGLMTSNDLETKTLAIKTAARGLRLLRHDENLLLPMVHQIWPPLLSRLTQDYSRNLEVNLCAFECLISVAIYSKDFIRRRTLDSIIPRLCLFLESQAAQSYGRKEYEPYCMTIAYKCQLRVLTKMGALAYHTQIAGSNLWRIVRTILKYREGSQVPSLREAALNSLKFLIALDADCVWYYAKQSKQLDSLPFGLVYESF